MSDFKYTIPISRVEGSVEDDSSPLYLFGEATGPERDTHKTRVTEEAILDLQRQIRERWESGDPIPYLDGHMKIVERIGGGKVKITPKGALTRLGHLVDSVIRPNGHLEVQVELDRLNPAARFIHAKAAAGYKYGMSVYGHYDPRTDVVREPEGIAFKRMDLYEVSNTTAPSWVHSLGTVLARSLDADDADEETTMSELAKDAEGAAPETETTEPAGVVENESTEAPAAESAETTEETTEREAESETEESTEEVERARISKKDNDAIVSAFTAFYTTLTGLGVELPTWEAVKPAEAVTEPAPEVTPEPAVTRDTSETGTEETVDFAGHAVERSVAEAMAAFVGDKLTEAAGVIERQAAYIAQLEALPAGKMPPVIVREKFDNPLDEITKIEDPEQRLRAALNAMYNNH